MDENESQLTSSEEEKVPAPNAEQSDSRLKGAARSSLRWLVGAAMLFIIGFAVAWFGRVQPLLEQRANLSVDLSAVQTENADLQAELDELREVEEQLAASRQRAAIHSILSDVNGARFALAQNDSAAAEAALEGTADHLDDLSVELGSDYESVIDELRDRLELALDGIEDDETFSALSDLDVLASRLLALEQDLFDS